jgi:hypothetical protein
MKAKSIVSTFFLAPTTVDSVAYSGVREPTEFSGYL